VKIILRKPVFLPDLREGTMKLTTLIIGVIGCPGLIISGCIPAVTTTAKTPPAAALSNHDARVVNLVWKPTMTGKDFDLEPLAPYKSMSVAFLSVIDVREDPQLIGKTFKDLKVREVVVPIMTRVNVSRWCKTAFENICREISLATSRKGSLRLEVEITGFQINDDFTQTGTATLHVSALTTKEMLIWEGSIQGTSDLYVHGTDSDGISECLSNTMMVTLYKMLTDNSFRDAVRKSIE
jgi:hypothetical protein